MEWKLNNGQSTKRDIQKWFTSKSSTYLQRIIDQIDESIPEKGLNCFESFLVNIKRINLWH